MIRSLAVRDVGEMTAAEWDAWSSMHLWHARQRGASFEEVCHVAFELTLARVFHKVIDQAFEDALERALAEGGVSTEAPEES